MEALFAGFVFGAVPPLNHTERLTLGTLVAAGAMIGAIVGGTGDIAAAIRQSKSPDKEKTGLPEMKYGRPLRNPDSKPDK